MCMIRRQNTGLACVFIRFFSNVSPLSLRVSPGELRYRLCGIHIHHALPCFSPQIRSLYHPGLVHQLTPRGKHALVVRVSGRRRPQYLPPPTPVAARPPSRFAAPCARLSSLLFRSLPLPHSLSVRATPHVTAPAPAGPSCQASSAGFPPYPPTIVQDSVTKGE